MSKSIILTDLEAQCPNLRYVIRPFTDDIPDQVIEFCIPAIFPKSTIVIGGCDHGGYSDYEDKGLRYKYYKLPWQPGDKLAVRESWRLHRGTGECGCGGDVCHCAPEGTIVYRAGGKDDEDKWRSPATMTLAYVRRWLIVESVECKRVGDVTKEEVKYSGISIDKYCSVPSSWQHTFFRLWRKRYSAQRCWIARVREVRE